MTIARAAAVTGGRIVGTEQVDTELGPIVIDSYVDPAIEEKEHFTPRQAKLVKDILNSAARFGMDHLPLKVKAQAAEAMGRYRMSFADAYDLYQKYIGDWGGKATVFRFEAVKNGEVVA